MKQFDNSRIAFRAAVEINIDTRSTMEQATKLVYSDPGAACIKEEHMTEQEVALVAEGGREFFISFGLVFLTGREQIRTNVGFKRCVINRTAAGYLLEATEPTSNPFVDETIKVPVVVMKGLVYCDLTALHSELREHYVI